MHTLATGLEAHAGERTGTDLCFRAATDVALGHDSEGVGRKRVEELDVWLDQIELDRQVINRNDAVGIQEGTHGTTCSGLALVDQATKRVHH